MQYNVLGWTTVVHDQKTGRKRKRMSSLKVLRGSPIFLSVTTKEIITKWPSKLDHVSPCFMQNGHGILNSLWILNFKNQIHFFSRTKKFSNFSVGIPILSLTISLLIFSNFRIVSPFFNLQLFYYEKKNLKQICLSIKSKKWTSLWGDLLSHIIWEACPSSGFGIATNY